MACSSILNESETGRLLFPVTYHAKVFSGII